MVNVLPPTLRPQTPAGMLHGLKPHVCQCIRISVLRSFTAVKRLLGNASSRDTELKEFPGGYHELLQGPEKEEAFVTLRDWVLRHSREPDAKL